jgi:hypothetical protein
MQQCRLAHRQGAGRAEHAAHRPVSGREVDDSCSAVAKAITQARGGRPTDRPTSTMALALLICSGVGTNRCWAAVIATGWSSVSKGGAANAAVGGDGLDLSSGWSRPGGAHGAPETDAEGERRARAGPRPETCRGGRGTRWSGR